MKSSYPLVRILKNLFHIMKMRENTNGFFSSLRNGLRLVFKPSIFSESDKYKLIIKKYLIHFS